MTNPTKSTKWLLITLIILTLISIGLHIFNRNDNFDTNFRQAIADYIHDKPKDGYNPVKNIDYFDGEKGERGERGPRGFKGERGDDGEDARSTYVTETVIKEVPVKGEAGKDGYTPVKGVDYFDGKTPVIRCNESKNRWERRYSDTESWTVIRNENEEPAKCRYLL